MENSAFTAGTGATILKLVRGGQVRVKAAADTPIEADDIIMVRATARQILDLIKGDRALVLSEYRRLATGTQRRPSGSGAAAQPQPVHRAQRCRRGFLEALSGQADRPGHRPGDQPPPAGRKASRRRGRASGDLGHGPGGACASTRTWWYSESDEDEFEQRRMWQAGGIVLAVILGATLTPLPIVVTAIAGVIAMAICGCIAREDLYSGVSWDVIFLLAGVIPLGVAMTKSGAADWIAGLIAVQALGWHPLLILLALYAVTTLLTEVVSNNAAVVILVPVALSIADALSLTPFSLVLVVMFAASTSFLSPVGYQTNTMIYGTGVYRFTDFVKVGAPLNTLLMVVTCVSIYLLWPL
ncbi:MAG: SLC13 family permease [bacterium]